MGEKNPNTAEAKFLSSPIRTAPANSNSAMVLPRSRCPRQSFLPLPPLDGALGLVPLQLTSSLGHLPLQASLVAQP